MLILKLNFWHSACCFFGREKLTLREFEHRSDKHGLVLDVAGAPAAGVLMPQVLMPQALMPQLDALLARGEAIAAANHAWVAQHAMFGPAVTVFLARLREIQATGPR